MSVSRTSARAGRARAALLATLLLAAALPAAAEPVKHLLPEDYATRIVAAKKGRVLLVNFWATWCEPCKRELPAFEQFSAEQGEDGAVVLAINTGEDEATVRAFLEAQGVEGLNVLIDPEATVARTYGVIQIPVTFVIDQAGNVRYPHYGEMTAADLAGYLEALAESDAPPASAETTEAAG